LQLGLLLHLQRQYVPKLLTHELALELEQMAPGESSKLTQQRAGRCLISLYRY
jgi:hypothetical protein